MFNVTNFTEHPGNPLYTVYKFKSKEESVMFQSLLQKEGLFYEADTGENEYGELELVAVKNKDEPAATKLNYIVLGRFRKPLIESKTVQTLVYAFTVFILGLAIAGFIMTE